MIMVISIRVMRYELVIYELVDNLMALAKPRLLSTA